MLRCSLLTVAFVIAATAVSLAQPVASTHFDGSTLEGWHLVDAEGGPAEGDLRWASDELRPGGYARFSDIGGDGGFLSAPLPFLGDWSSLADDGTLCFEHRIIVIHQLVEILPYEVRLSGPGGYAQFIGSAPSGVSGWNQIVVPLNQSSWTLISGTWQDLLNNVTNLRIRIELVWGADDVEGMDNIELFGGSASVPTYHTNCITWGRLRALFGTRER
jgi:hypothetical protein